MQAIIFDLDGVLCELDHGARLRYLSTLSTKSPEEIHDAIWCSGFEDLSDSGQLSADEYLRGFGERIGYPLSEAEWSACRRAGTKPDPASLSIAASLRGRVGLALLTNNGFLLKRTMKEVCPDVPSLFGEHVYVSAEFGIRKPEPHIFLEVCERLGSDAARTLMIDDRAENIDGAREAGLGGHLFRGATWLEREIREKRGVME